MDSEHNDKLHKVAESAYLQIASKISGIVIMGLCAWILNAVVTMQTDMATVAEGIRSVDTRVANLESWRNMLEAYGNPLDVRKK